VEIVGGSAISIYLSSADHVSQDVELVGRRDRITPILRRWKFQEVEGRSHRAYWFKRAIGLVDLVGAGDRSGLRPRRLVTPHGPVLVSAVEALIVRRLTRAHREKSNDLFNQAVELARQEEVDWEHVGSMARYEGTLTLLRKLRKSVRKQSSDA